MSGRNPNDSISLPALLAVLLGVSIVTLDISLTSTALPTIAVGIGASPVETIWIVNAYYLSVIAVLMPLAALGEIHGHRRIFLAGLAVFAIGSLASGLANSLVTLAVSRALLGTGAAAVAATTPALVRAIYPSARLGRGLGLYALVVGLAISIGPTAASAILAVTSWRWLFLVNIPLAILALLLARRGLPQTELNVRPFDGWSALLCAATFAGLLYGIAGIAHHADWRSTAASLVLAMGCGALLRRREAGHAAPILAVDLFRIPLFALSSVTSICAFTIQGLILVVLPFLFQFQLGFTQVEAGLLITPWPATLAAMTLIAAPLSDRVPPGLLGGIGLLAVTIGLALLATLSPSPAIVDIVWRLVLCGIGFGLFQSPNMRAIMGSVPPSRSGGASGIVAASRLIGQALGAASVAVCLSISLDRGVDAAIWVGVVAGAIGSAVSFARLLPAVRID